MLLAALTLSAVAAAADVQVALVPSEGLVLTSQPDGLGVWKLDEAKRERSITAEIERMTLTESGKTIFAAVKGGAVAISIASGRPLHRFELEQGEKSTSVATRQRIGAAGTADGYVHLWDLMNGEKLRKFEVFGGSVRALAFSPDGKTLAACGDATTKLLDPAVGQSLRDLGVQGCFAIAFTPGGRRIAVGSATKGSEATYWDVQSGKLIRRFSGHGAPVEALAINADATMLATGAVDGVRIFDINTGKLVRNLPGHDGGVVSTQFVGDGARLITGGKDGVARVWDVANGSLTAELKP